MRKQAKRAALRGKLGMAKKAPAGGKKKKSVVSKAHKLGKKVGKAGALLGAVGGDPVTAGVVKAIAGRHKGGKKRIKAAARHMGAGTEAKGRKVKKVLKKAKARVAKGEKAFKGKYGKLGNKISSRVQAKTAAAKKAIPGAVNPAKKAVRALSGPRKAKGRRGSGLRRGRR